MVLKITPKQRTKINALVRMSCCNCYKGNCLLLDDGEEAKCVQLISRYQVLVTVHLNTENVHCHFVVNSVSFKDGTKFQNKIGDHKELRRVSDEICREQGLSVLENSSFYGGHKKRLLAAQIR